MWKKKLIENCCRKIVHCTHSFTHTLALTHIQAHVRQMRRSPKLLCAAARDEHMYVCYMHVQWMTIASAIRAHQFDGNEWVAWYRQKSSWRNYLLVAQIFLIWLYNNDVSVTVILQITFEHIHVRGEIEWSVRMVVETADFISEVKIL